jgi:hypothetical protein
MTKETVKIDTRYPKSARCIQSTFTPDGWKQATFNDLARHHAGAKKESLFQRIVAGVKETIDEI